jgi:hypothetical protein
MQLMMVEHCEHINDSMQPIVYLFPFQWLLLFFVYWLKHIMEMLLRGSEFSCSFGEFVAIDDNVLWLNVQSSPWGRECRSGKWTKWTFARNLSLVCICRRSLMTCVNIFKWPWWYTFMIFVTEILWSNCLHSNTIVDQKMNHIFLCPL